MVLVELHCRAAVRHTDTENRFMDMGEGEEGEGGAHGTLFRNYAIMWNMNRQTISINRYKIQGKHREMLEKHIAVTFLQSLNMKKMGSFRPTEETEPGLSCIYSLQKEVICSGSFLRENNPLSFASLVDLMPSFASHICLISMFQVLFPFLKFTFVYIKGLLDNKVNNLSASPICM